MKRVLVIDDNEMMRQMIRDMLELEGYEVEEAENGRQGVMRFLQAPADLVITDILMPDEDGLEIVRKLRRDYPEVRIIVISGGLEGKIDYLSFAKEFGADRAIAKPFDSRTLLGAVRELTGGQ
ncbi:MAG: response regulator [bacterium]|nr:response regulator [bacterium]